MPVTVCACRTSSYLALRTLPTHQPRAASCGLHLLSYTNSRQQDVATQRSTANNVVAVRTATGSCRWHRVIFIGRRPRSRSLLLPSQKAPQGSLALVHRGSARSRWGLLAVRLYQAVHSARAHYYYCSHVIILLYSKQYR